MNKFIGMLKRYGIYHQMSSDGFVCVNLHAGNPGGGAGQRNWIQICESSTGGSSDGSPRLECSTDWNSGIKRASMTWPLKKSWYWKIVVAEPSTNGGDVEVNVVYFGQGA